MRRFRWLSLFVLLLMAALACNVPFMATESQVTATAANVQSLAAQTIAAQLAVGTSTALSQSVDITATTGALNATATVAALSANATLEAQSADATNASLNLEATAQAGDISATYAAQALQATAFAQQATAAALNFPPVQPPPPLPPPPQPQPPFPQPQPPFPQPPPPQYNYIRISFAPGGTSANVDGVLKQGHQIDYVVKAGGGQTMLVTVFSPGNNVYLGVVGLTDGIPLLRTVAGQSQFTGNLPLTQDYRLTLISPNQKSNYTLQVIIPARIKFAHGSYGTNVNGYVTANTTNFYLLRASAGQTMSVAILSPGSNIKLTIYGMQDGSPLVRAMNGATSWNGVLPGTQDYMIEAVSFGPASNYTIQVTVH